MPDTESRTPQLDADMEHFRRVEQPVANAHLDTAATSLGHYLYWIGRISDICFPAVDAGGDYRNDAMAYAKALLQAIDHYLVRGPYSTASERLLEAVDKLVADAEAALEGSTNA